MFLLFLYNLMYYEKNLLFWLIVYRSPQLLALSLLLHVCSPQTVGELKLKCDHHQELIACSMVQSSTTLLFLHICHMS